MKFIIGNTNDNSAPITVETSDSLDKLMPALIAAIKGARNPKKDAQNPHLKNRFASLGAVLEEMRSAGFIPIQLPVVCNGQAGVFTTLWFENQFIAWPFLMPMSKNDAQSVGSAVSYARRYSLQTILQMVGEDDDGEAAVGRHAKPALASTQSRSLESVAEPDIATGAANKLMAMIRATTSMDELKQVCNSTLQEYKSLPKDQQDAVNLARNRRIQDLNAEGA